MKVNLLVLKFQWTPGDFVITDNMALGHRADDDATLSSRQIGLRVIHRSSAFATKAAPPARGYVKRAKRKVLYLKRKEDLEKDSTSGIVDIRQWCPENDAELCGENGELVTFFEITQNDLIDENDIIIDKDVTFKYAPHRTSESTSTKDEL